MSDTNTTGTPSPEIQSTSVAPVAPVVTYPRIEKSTVKIIRKVTKPLLPEEGVTTNSAEDYFFCVGSAFASFNSPVLLGRVILTPEEEMRIMPLVMKIQPNHPNWHSMVDDYWKDFRVPIPFEGKTLDTSVRFNSADDPGTPVNPEDWVLWKYCMRYGRCAKSLEEANNSPKILFVLYNETAELKRKETALKLKDDAFQLRMSIVREPVKIDAVLSLYNKDITTMAQIDKELALSELADKDPNKFIQIGSDNNLQMKAFVMRCINAGLLYRPENSSIIIYDGTQTIAHSMDEAVAFLNDAQNTQIRLELEGKLAQLKR